MCTVVTIVSIIIFRRLRYSITRRQYVLAGNISDQSGVRTQLLKCMQPIRFLYSKEEGGGLRTRYKGE